MRFRSKLSTPTRHGFGLIELMVSMSIMALVSTIIMTRQSTFNGAVLLRNQAYEVAFALREVQLLAVSGGDESVRSYAVVFDTGAANQHSYRMYGDRDGDDLFETTEQIGQTGRLDTRFEIRAATPSGASPLTIIFTRPNFDAQFCNRTGGCSLPVHFATGPAYIDVARTNVVTNGYGDVRRVQVSATGQISVITY